MLKLEFRAAVNADSGVFLRKPQLQCRDYLVAGPYKNLKNYKPQDWNTLLITVHGNLAHCECNGEVLEDAPEVARHRPHWPGSRPRPDGISAHSDYKAEVRRGVWCLSDTRHKTTRHQSTSHRYFASGTSYDLIRKFLNSTAIGLPL